MNRAGGTVLEPLDTEFRKKRIAGFAYAAGEEQTFL